MTNNVPTNLFIDEGIPGGTVGNVASVVELLSVLEGDRIDLKAHFGLYLILIECAAALRYAETELSYMDKNLTIELPDPEFVELARVAELRGVSVQEAARGSIKAYIARMSDPLGSGRPATR